MKTRLESTHRAQIQWKEIEEQRAVRFRRQRNHFAFLILPRVVVNPLQICGLSAQAGTVVHQLAVDFARRKIDERHCSSVLESQPAAEQFRCFYCSDDFRSPSSFAS